MGTTTVCVNALLSACVSGSLCKRVCLFGTHDNRMWMCDAAGLLLSDYVHTCGYMN